MPGGMLFRARGGRRVSIEPRRVSVGRRRSISDGGNLYLMKDTCDNGGGSSRDEEDGGDDGDGDRAADVPAKLAVDVADFAPEEPRTEIDSQETGRRWQQYVAGLRGSLAGAVGGGAHLCGRHGQCSPRELGLAVAA
ncbi:hypothetical protein GW17_00000024 [Ensete ventricosum]|nr:hypothetical protein GW17_00000024 [Ensete ventricosum]